jgi:hypothetical protein
MRYPYAGLAAVVLLSFGPVPLAAQTSRGTVTGLILDPSGSAVPSAAVELRHVETGVKRQTSTNEAGIYRFDAVDPGSHEVTLRAPGFKALVTRGFDVQAGLVSTVDARLEVGETQITVEVVENAILLQTQAPVRGGNLTAQQIAELPYAVRNPTELALTLPGVSTNRFGRGTQTYIVNGGRNRSNNFLLDGTENNDISVAGQGFQLTNPDAVREVSVQTSNFDAEYGRAGGAIFNVITRSGSNEYHGAVSYLLDSTSDDAITNTQALAPEVQRRGRPLPGTEQWMTGSMGGAVVRDRTFWFASYQERRQNSQAAQQVTTLSPRGRATLNSLFPRGRNRQADLFNEVSQPAGDATSQFFPVVLGDGRPNLEFGTAVIPYAQTRTDRLWITRFDHRLGRNDHLTLRYAADRDTRPVGGENTSFPGLFTSQRNTYHNALLSETRVFSPVLTNELRVSYNRIALEFPLDPANPLGRTMPEYRIAGITVTNVFSIGVTPNFPQGRIANNYVLQDTTTWLRGGHTLRAGFDLLSQRSKQFAPIVERGRLTYQASPGFSGFANFLDDFGGVAGAAEKTFGDPAYYPELFRQAYFVQDRWRLTETVTLSLGLRYENFGTPMNSVHTAAWSGLFNVDPVTFDGPYRLPSKVRSDRNNFAPVAGLAWSPSRDTGWLGRMLGRNRTVIRLGYGIGYDSFFNNIASNAQGSAPNVLATATVSLADAANPRGLPNLSRLIPTVPRPIQPTDAQALTPGDLVNPYYQRWSAGVQREMPGDMLLDVSYVGSKGTKLYLTEQLNPTVPSGLRVVPQTATPISAARLQPRLDALQGSRLIRTNGGDSNYHSLQVFLTRRLARGLSGTASYTWSKLIDNGGDIFTITQVNQTQNPAVPAFWTGGLRFDRSVSVYDRTQRAAFAFAYEFPWRRQQHGVAGRLLGGWQVTTLVTFESGVPLNVTNGQDADGLDGAGDRPDYNPLGEPRVRAVPSLTSPTGYVNPDAGNAPIDPADAQYIGLHAFAGAPQPARTGNLGRNTLRTPGINNFDVNLFKRVWVSERLAVELRTEFYNLFNHPQYGYPSVSPFAPGNLTQIGAIAASVTSAPPGRFLQPHFVDGGGRVIRHQLKIRF